jgi:hypothetical protein
LPVESGKDFKGVTTELIKSSIVADGTVNIAVCPLWFKHEGGVGVAKVDHFGVGEVFQAVHNSIVAKAVADLLGDAAWNYGFDGARMKDVHASRVYRYTPLLLP